MSLLENLGIKHPIFLAPMAGVSTPELAAEVSNQGGLGSLGLGASSIDAARQQILKTQELTDCPFQVKDYGHAAVIGMSQWAKQVGREKHRMEAFVRFKKAKDGLFLSLVRPDFNVLPIISRHFQERYQDQSWLIYDEQRNYGIYYDLRQMHQVEMNAEIIDPQIRIGHSQSFSIELDDQELLYDQLWKDYFNSVNIQARKNMKLHIQYVPKR